MSKKIWDIANGDLLFLSASIEKITAAAISTYSHLDHLADVPGEKKATYCIRLILSKTFPTKSITI